MRTLPVAAALLTATALLAGCGDDGDAENGGADAGAPEDVAEVAFAEQDGEAIVEASKEAMAGLTSLRVTGELAQASGTLTMDVAVAADQCRGSIRTPEDQTIELLGVGDTIWIRPDDAFWRAYLGEEADSFLASVGDKWSLFPQDLGYEQFCNFEDIVDDEIAEKDYETGEVADVNGAAAVAVTGTDDDGVETVGHVLVEGDHYLVGVESDGEQAVDITYSDFDVPVDAEEPAPADVLDLSQIE